MNGAFKLRVTPAAALAIAAAACFLDNDMLWSLALSAACHEAGHLVTLGLCGAPLSGLTLSAAGLEARFEPGRLSYGAEAICSLSGPVVGALLAALAAKAGDALTAGVSLLLTLFNLLPAYPLDGGRALRAAVSYIAGPAAGAKMAKISGLTAAAGLTALGLALCVKTHTLSVLPFLGAWLLAGYCKNSPDGVE